MKVFLLDFEDITVRLHVNSGNLATSSDVTCQTLCRGSYLVFITFRDYVLQITNKGNILQELTLFNTKTIYNICNFLEQKQRIFVSDRSDWFFITSYSTTVCGGSRISQTGRRQTQRWESQSIVWPIFSRKLLYNGTHRWCPFPRPWSTNAQKARLLELTTSIQEILDPSLLWD